MKKEVILGGGCFWCTEADLRKIEGVIDVMPGYAGEKEGSPTYENHNGYREAVRVEYDEEKVTYKKICQFFLDHIDPTDAGGQFFDRGDSYKTAIYYDGDEEKFIAESLIKELEESGLFDKPIATEVLKKAYFYVAEDYHQNYADKNPVRYGLYKEGSGRVLFVNNVCQAREEKNIKWKD